MNEAVFISVPRAICHLFANLLLHCQPSDPLTMYNQFRDSMSEDFLRRRMSALNLTESERHQLAWNDLLSELNYYLERGCMTNADFDIPMPDNSLQDVVIIEDGMEHDPDARQFLRGTARV